MRHKIVAIGLLIAMLLPCLTFLEFLELTTFHDDPSNAFILTADSGRSSRITIAHTSIKPANEMQESTPIFTARRQQMSRSEFSSACAPQDLLALFSLRRT
ncbi:MAG: hypothetical protein ACRD8A_08590 [Candidatus Acidiferrales bacterium]